MMTKIGTLTILIAGLMTVGAAEARNLASPVRAARDNPHSAMLVRLARELQAQHRRFQQTVRTWPLGAARIMNRLAVYDRTFLRYDQILTRYWNHEARGGGGGSGGTGSRPGAPGSMGAGAISREGGLSGKVLRCDPGSEPPTFSVAPLITRAGAGAGILRREVGYSSDREISLVARSPEDLEREGVFAGAYERERFLSEAAVDWDEEMVILFSPASGHGQEGLVLEDLDAEGEKINVRIRHLRWVHVAADADPPAVSVSIGFALVVSRSNRPVQFHLDSDEIVIGSKSPLAGAQVTVMVPGRSSSPGGGYTARRVFTDARGRFELAGLPPGDLRIEISADGYETQELTARIGSVLDVTLWPLAVGVDGIRGETSMELPATASLDDPFGVRGSE